MKQLLPNIGPALMLTPGIFLLAFWIIVLSSGDLVALIGWLKILLWALLLAFGAAYSITLFAVEILKRRDRE